MKVSAKYYREIEYVVVDELPAIQQELLKNYREADYIKILVDGEVIGPCLQYKHYSNWFSSVYQLNQKIAKDTKVVQKPDLQLVKL